LALQVGTSDNVLIAGFIVSGNASKRVIIPRARPLAGGFVPQCFWGPRLDLRSSGSSIGTNSDWQTADERDYYFRPGRGYSRRRLAPGNPLGRPSFATLSPVLLEAIVRGKEPDTGVGIVRSMIWSNNGSSLANLNRGFYSDEATTWSVWVGDSMTSNHPSGGPSLIPFGVGNALTCPQLEVHERNGTIAVQQRLADGTDPVNADVGGGGSGWLAPGSQLNPAVCYVSARPHTTIVQGKLNYSVSLDLKSAAPRRLYDWRSLLTTQWSIRP